MRAMEEPSPALASEKMKLWAYALPMFLFIALLALVSALKRPDAGTLWLAAPEFWIYPMQTVLCAGLLWWFRRHYQAWNWRGLAFAFWIGVAVFVLWIAPQQFLGLPMRLVGFNPNILADDPALYWATLVMRFLRLVVIVPLVEEIFWRGFLLRYLISERFDAVPFGSFSWLSFGVVSVAFALSHSMADWPAALVTGGLYNLVAYRSKSLGACVLAHSVTNLMLGVWIVATRQWGFW